MSLPCALGLRDGELGSTGGKAAGYTIQIMWPVVTTFQNCLYQAPELANAASLQSTAAQTMFLQDAADWLNPYVWGSKLELGQRLLACHLMVYVSPTWSRRPDLGRRRGLG